MHYSISAIGLLVVSAHAGIETQSPTSPPPITTAIPTIAPNDGYRKPTPSPTLRPPITTTIPTIAPKDVYRKSNGIFGTSGAGGTCLCPSGIKYVVADNYDGCESIQCEGGISELLCEDPDTGLSSGYQYAAANGKSGWGVICAAIGPNTPVEPTSSPPTPSPTSSTPTPSPTSSPPTPSPISSPTVITPDFIEDVPEISQTDIAKVTNWIKHEVTMVKNPFCWKQSYGRGVGVPLSTCLSNKDKIGALCYSKCPSGMSRFGFDCHSNCPSGSSSQGLFCRWNEYGRGAGYPWTFSDGLSDSGMYSRCERAHGRGKCEKWGAVVYPKCRSGYSPFGCCICRPKVPNCSSYSLNDGIDLSCAKKVIIGDPKPMNCKSWQDEDAGLCYEPCDSGMYGVGPVCWQSCDNSMVDCGAGCAKSSGECALAVANQVLAPLILAANVASLGLATPATASTGAAVNTIKVGGKTVAGTSKLGKVFVTAVKTLQTAGSVQKIDGVENAVKGVKVLQRFRNAKTGTTVKKTWTTIKISKKANDISDDITDDATFSRDAYGALKEYKEEFANDFADQTSSDINNELNRKFNPTTAQFLKETWAEYALNELAEAEAWQIASTTLGLVSIVDITGVTGVVEAYAKPVCNDVIQFPALSFTV